MRSNHFLPVGSATTIQSKPHEELETNEAADGVTGEAEYQGLARTLLLKDTEPNGLTGFQIDLVKNLAHAEFREYARDEIQHPCGNASGENEHVGCQTLSYESGQFCALVLGNTERDYFCA